MIEPSAVILYVANPHTSSAFYQDVLGIKPEEASPTFHSFRLSNGMGLGLKARHAVESPTENTGSGELAFIVENNQQVDDLFAQWQAKEITIPVPPTGLPYGYTFLALDPDGNRLRVVSLTPR